MKKILLIILLFCFAKAQATNYYMSATGGDGGSGTSQATAWQTLGKLNTSFGSMSAGDSVLFRRGDTFLGGILVNKSGIKIGAYGTGANPIITGLYTIPAWTNLGSNVWESTSAVSTLSYLNIVLINGVNTAMGRTPNTTWYTYQSHAGKGQVTSSDLTGTPNWTGAEAAIFITTYGINRCPITSQSTGTINFTYDAVQENIQADNQKFFIQNDVRTLDVQNEWYYNPTTKKLRIFSTSSPVNVQVPTVEVTAEIHNGGETSLVTISNIDFVGANSDLLLLKRVLNCKIQNCNFSFAGRNGLNGPYWGSSVGLVVDGCTFKEINNTAIGFTEEFTKGTVTNNVIRNISNLEGMGAPAGDYSYSGLYTGIHFKGEKTKVNNNRLNNIAYNGIVIAGDSSETINNYVDTACTYIHDGGGIYTWNGSNESRYGQKIQGNIVRNIPEDVGIYTDDGSNGVEISGNTVENCYQGYYFHNNWNLNVHNNLAYNNGYTGVSFFNDDPSVTMVDNKLVKNIFIGKTSTQRAAFFYTMEDTRDGLSVADSNVYAVPINNSTTIDGNYGGAWGRKTFEQWQTISGKEANSSKLFKTISDVNDFRFEFNETSSPKIVSLAGYYWLDANQNSKFESITLQPFESVLLLRNGSYTPGSVGSTNVWSTPLRVRFVNN